MNSQLVLGGSIPEGKASASRKVLGAQTAVLSAPQPEGRERGIPSTSSSRSEAFCESAFARWDSQ